MLHSNNIHVQQQQQHQLLFNQTQKINFYNVLSDNSNSNTLSPEKQMIISHVSRQGSSETPNGVADLEAQGSLNS
jgi:hypothetical protein